MFETLTPCPVCGHMLSPWAGTCPACGHPLRVVAREEGFFLRTMNLLTQVVVGTLAGILNFALIAAILLALSHFLRR